MFRVVLVIAVSGLLELYSSDVEKFAVCAALYYSNTTVLFLQILFSNPELSNSLHIVGLIAFMVPAVGLK